MDHHIGIFSDDAADFLLRYLTQGATARGPGGGGGAAEPAAGPGGQAAGPAGGDGGHPAGVHAQPHGAGRPGRPGRRAGRLPGCRRTGRRPGGGGGRCAHGGGVAVAAQQPHHLAAGPRPGPAWSIEFKLCCGARNSVGFSGNAQLEPFLHLVLPAGRRQIPAGGGRRPCGAWQEAQAHQQGAPPGRPIPPEHLHGGAGGCREERGCCHRRHCLRHSADPAPPRRAAGAAASASGGGGRALSGARGEAIGKAARGRSQIEERQQGCIDAAAPTLTASCWAEGRPDLCCGYQGARAWWCAIPSPGNTSRKVGCSQ
mmetsp:Transcript_39892/g.65889  ORF Transcript_39892/g.65889 Transcript_39892/m.65889 type:complete len:314 (+) Transcript_39892:729-1670(+)